MYFRTLSGTLDDDFIFITLKEEWIKCAKLIPEEHNHTTEYYINAPYKLDWNDSLTENEYCDKDLLKMFGYEVKINSYKKQLCLNDTFQKIYKIINNGK